MSATPAHRGPWLPLLLATALLPACASYEPPQPGKHRGPGEPRAELECRFEAPGGTLFAQKSCRRLSEAERRGELDREMADSLRAPPPEIK